MQPENAHSSLSKEEILHKFTVWAASKGVEISVTKAAYIPGRGIGLVADEHIAQGHVSVSVNKSAMLTPLDPEIQSMLSPAPASARREPGGIAKLAAFFTVSPGVYPEWQATWPSVLEVHSAFPFFWHHRLQEKLPAGARQKLSLQVDLVESQWQSALGHCPLLSLEDRSCFMYYYFLMNSRTMYWTYGQDPINCSIPSQDRIALCPFLDLVNHSTDSEPAVQKAQGYSLRSHRTLSKGEELTVSYGAHDNDTLLTEYGFLIDHNPADMISIDDLFDSLLSPAQAETLSEVGFLHSYSILPGLDGDDPSLCFRSQVALLYLVLGNTRQWHQFKDGVNMTAFPPFYPSSPVIKRFCQRLCEEITRGKAICSELRSELVQGRAIYPQSVLGVICKRWETIIRNMTYLKSIFSREEQTR